MKYITLFLILITLTVVHVAHGYDKARKTQILARAIEYQKSVERHCKLAFPNPAKSREKCIQEKSVLMAMKPTGLR